MEGSQIGIPRDMPPTRQIWRNILVLTWPSAVELTLASLLGMITMAMVSPLGKEVVSAVGITTQPIMIPHILLQGFAVGGTALVARSIGQDSPTAVRSASEQAMFLSILASILAGMVMYFFGGTFILWMGATEDYYYLGEMYMRFCAIGGIFQSISAAVSALLRGEGRTRLSMQFSVAANIVNIIVGYMLIYGFGPFPAMGLLGAGWAQLVGKFIGFLYAMAILLFSRGLLIKPRLLRMFLPEPGVIARICRIGVSSAMEQVVMRVGVMLFTVYVVHLGTAEYAAHNIAGTVHIFVVNFGMAISMALVSLVGQNLGMGRPDVAEKYFNESIKISLICSLILMVPLLVFPQSIARIFTTEADVVANIVMILRILAGFVFAQVYQICVCGGLRGGGDTKWPLYSTMGGVLCMRMVMGYFFIVQFQWGLAGAWWCWFLDQVARALIIHYRFRSGKWKTIKI
jgi:putative MATE family efflux protein